MVVRVVVATLLLVVVLVIGGRAGGGGAGDRDGLARGVAIRVDGGARGRRGRRSTEHRARGRDVVVGFVRERNATSGVVHSHVGVDGLADGRWRVRGRIGVMGRRVG
jgi:hypothetical protein